MLMMLNDKCLLASLVPGDVVVLCTRSADAELANYWFSAGVCVDVLLRCPEVNSCLVTLIDSYEIWHKFDSYERGPV
jgi:hypothetical protein